MRIHYLQHVPFEDLANIQLWANERGFPVSRTAFYADEPLPALDAIEWLIIMGGPMNVYEDEKYPWLVRERRFIKKAIDAGKVVLGICLGAQLIADVLGAKVYRNEHAEIGWFPISLIEDKGLSDSKEKPVFYGFPRQFMAFHWHGDTFDLPKNAIQLVRSEACENQAFQFKKTVIGLQFHLESSLASISRLIENCPEDLKDGKYIQNKKNLLLNENHVKVVSHYMTLFMENIEKRL